jgi:YggT family protein
VANFLLQLIDLAFTVFELLILARILLSWFQLNPYNPVVQFLYSVTEPILAPIRRRMPSMGMFDFSPMIAIIIAIIAQRILESLVISLFFR